MRLSSAEFSQATINDILKQQSQLSHIQQQLSTGRKIVTPADNPAGAAQALDLQSAIGTNTQYQKNGDAASAGLNLEQSTLGSVENILQTVRTLALQGNNATQNNTSRASIGMQVEQSLQQLLGYANTRNSAGHYIFSGSKTSTQPFASLSSGQFSYAGDAIQRFMQIDSSRQIAGNDSGAAVFMEIRNGNGTFTAMPGSGNTGTGVISPGSVTDRAAYTGDTYQITLTSSTQYQVKDTTTNSPVTSGTYAPSGTALSFAGIQVTLSGDPAMSDTFTLAPSRSQSIFQTLQNLARVMTTPATGTQGLTQLHNTINQSLASLDQSLNHIINKQASVGSRLGAIQSQQQLQQNWGIQLQSAQAQIQNVNIAQAVSQYQQQLTALRAAEQTYTKVQGLSLFKYL